MYVLGINPDGEYFKTALVKLKKGKLSIIFIQEFKKDSTNLNFLKKKIVKETGYREDNVEVVSALGSEEIFIRHLELPFKNKKSILKALPFQMETLLPFNQEYATTIPLIKKKKKGSEVILYSFLNDSIEKHIETVKTFGFDPDWVTCVPTALLRFAKRFSPDTPSPLIFHFGWERSYIIYVQEGAVRKSLVIKVGFKNFIDAVKKQNSDFAGIDFQFIKDEIKRTLSVNQTNGLLSEIIEDLRRQFHRVMEFISRKEDTTLIDGILFTGYADIIKLIVSSEDGFSMPSIEIIPNLLYKKEKTVLFAIELGLAFDTLEKDASTLQFRVGQFTATKQIEKVKKKTKMAAIFSVFCSFILFSSLTLKVIDKENSNRRRFNQIAAIAGENPTSFPKMQTVVLNLNDREKEIKTLYKKIQQREKGEIYFKDPIFFHQCLEKILQAGSDLIDITELQYGWEKYPHIKNPKGNYQILVQVSFVAQNEGNAKLFFDKLMGLVDDVILKGETTFTSEKNSYQINFSIQS